MRIKPAFIVGMRDAFGLGHGLAHRDDGSGAAKVQQEGFKLCFKIQAMPQDQISAGHGNDVAAGLAIGVRIDTRTHQCGDGDKVAPDLSSGIGHHPGGGNHRQGGLCQRKTRQGKAGGKGSQDMAACQGHAVTF